MWCLCVRRYGLLVLMRASMFSDLPVTFPIKTQLPSYLKFAQDQIRLDRASSAIHATQTVAAHLSTLTTFMGFCMRRFGLPPEAIDLRLCTNQLYLARYLALKWQRSSHTQGVVNLIAHVRRVLQYLKAQDRYDSEKVRRMRHWRLSAACPTCMPTCKRNSMIYVKCSA